MPIFCLTQQSKKLSSKQQHRKTISQETILKHTIEKLQKQKFLMV